MTSVYRCIRKRSVRWKRLSQTKARDAKDSARYKRIYGIDNNDTSIADLVIDTEGKTPEEIVNIIIQAVQKN